MAHQAIAAGRHDPEVLRAAGLALGCLADENETALDALDRALVLGRLNRPDEAIAAAENAIRLSPQHPDVYVFSVALASVHMAVSRYEEALLWADPDG